jgi:phytoene desaturase
MIMAKKIIVIGSGFGGLAAALRLRAKGFDVTLVEKHQDLGGRARVFKKDKFIYDGGPTVITAPYLFEELFTLFNKKISNYVEIVPLNLWYRFVFDDGEKFDYSGNDQSMQNEIEKFSKNDFFEFKKLISFTEKIFNKGFADRSEKPLLNIFSVKLINFLNSKKSFLENFSISFCID